MSQAFTEKDAQTFQEVLECWEGLSQIKQVSDGYGLMTDHQHALHSDAESLLARLREAIQPAPAVPAPKTCETCVFWKENLSQNWKSWHKPLARFGVCAKNIGQVASFPTESGCVGDGRDEDGSGEGRTGPKFGCLHHSAR